MSICLCVHLSVCPSVSVSICLCVHLSVCPSVSVSICQCVHLSVCVRDVSLSIHVQPPVGVLCLCIFHFMQGPFQCKACRNFRIVHDAAGDGIACHNGTQCVPACPDNYYTNGSDCNLCHELCVGGCTGPGNFVGQGGCNMCDFVNFDQNDTQVRLCCVFCACVCAYWWCMSEGWMSVSLHTYQQ